MNTRLYRFRRRLEGYWFADAPASRLAVLRILIGSFALWYCWTRYDMMREIGRSEASLFDPVGMARILDAPMPPVIYDVMLIAVIVLGFAFILGVRFRYTGPAFALLLLCVLSYRNSWSMVYHSRDVVVLHVLILALTPAADALSWDALRKQANRGRRYLLWQSRRRNPAGDPAYGWPIRLLVAVTLVLYFLPGVAKVMSELGWAWGTGSALREQIAADALRKGVLGDTPSAWAFALYNQTWLFTLAGVGTLAIELLAPFVIINRKLARVWAVLAFGMHWGIFFIMGIRFRYQLVGIIFAPFFDVEKPVEWLRRRLSGAETTPRADDAPEQIPENRKAPVNI